MNYLKAFRIWIIVLLWYAVFMISFILINVAFKDDPYLKMDQLEKRIEHDRIELEELNQSIYWVIPKTETVETWNVEIKKIQYYKASRYRYDLKWIERSKTHRTAASRFYPKWSTLEVCHWYKDDKWYFPKCVIVTVNDYGPKEYTNVDIDLSEYSFSQISSLSKWIIDVTIQQIK